MYEDKFSPLVREKSFEQFVSNGIEFDSISPLISSRGDSLVEIDECSMKRVPEKKGMLQYRIECRCSLIRHSKNLQTNVLSRDDKGD